MNNLVTQKQASESLRHQDTAMQIIRAGSNIATAQQLADYCLATDEEGRHINPRYKDGSDAARLSWLGDQFHGLALIAHFAVDKNAIKIDVLNLDKEIMENNILRGLTLVEMQEAFRKGVMKEYGDYYGITSISMLGFLKGFLKSDKKQEAMAIVYKHNERMEQEKDARFFRELYEAQRAGKIQLPDFSSMRINGPHKKKTYTAEESAAHRAKVRQQAEEILKQAGNGKEEE